MNTMIKIATGMFAGLIAGTMLVGTAVAAPRTVSAAGFSGNGMMRSLGASGTFDSSTVAEMNSFMDQYRQADGSIDVNRMHSDVASGKVTPPCAGGTSSTGQTATSQGGGRSYRGGPAMMQGQRSGRSSTGYQMMGSTY